MIKPIHQQQPTGDTCTSACIAMAINKPVDVVIAGFHEKYFAVKTNATEYLMKFVECKEYPYHTRELPAGLFLLTVPSLNLRGILHNILIHVYEGGHDVYDPNRGKQGKAFYVNQGGQETDMMMPIKGFQVDLQLIGWEKYYEQEQPK